MHEEPVRLFLDNSRDTVQMFTLISIISSGVHRLSEIASRMGKPVTHLNRPLQRLIDLGYLKEKFHMVPPPAMQKKNCIRYQIFLSIFISDMLCLIKHLLNWDWQEKYMIKWLYQDSRSIVPVFGKIFAGIQYQCYSGINCFRRVPTGGGLPKV